jgi:cytoskeleton protein RodZ
MSDTAPMPLEATAGGLLRAARQRQGMHLAVLAASLKVAPRKLELLEADRYDELLDATFVRALALSMCRALKLDAAPVLARLPQAPGPDLMQVASGLNQPYRERDARHDGGTDGGWRLSVPMAAVVLLLLGALLVYFVPRERWPDIAVGTETTTAAVPQAVMPPVPAAAPGVEPAAEAASAAVGASGAAPMAAAEAVPAAASAIVETVFSVPDGGAVAPAAAGLLTLRTSAESWVEVRDGGGQLLLSRTLAAGESAVLDGAVPLRLTIGNAEATQVVFRGQPVTLPAVTRDNVARLELK